MAHFVFGAVLVLTLLCSASWARVAGQGKNAASPSVWDGVFSTEQAERGWQAYAENCSSCHGAELQGTADAKTLKGDRFWTDWKETTVDYLLERISRSMPFSDDGKLAGTLPEQTYIDIVAHILSANAFPAGKNELTHDSSLGVQIIRKEGPGELPASTLAQVVGCLTRAGNGTWRLTNATPPVRVRGGTAAHANTAVASVNSREFELKFVLTPLDKLAGHRVTATGLLIGEGGKDGLNLSSATSISPACE